MKLKILGSVSPYCKNTCNCPGYLVKTPHAKILLDAGNGICGNLEFPRDLENLYIIISHLHKDHYGDLSAIGDAYYVHHKIGNVIDKPKLYIPTVKDNEESYIDYLYIKNCLGKKFDIFEYSIDTKLVIDDISISFMQTKHSILCYATRLNDLVYSADTGLGSHDNFVKFANNANTFICEASFIKEHHAINDGHLCAHEAALIAKDANINRLIITHLWPEENKDKYLKEAKEVFENSFIAKENDLYDL